jgi:hypothetical protein
MSDLITGMFAGIVIGAVPVYGAWNRDRRRWTRKLARAVGHPAGRGGAL